MQLGPIRENSRAATGQSLHSIGAMPAPTMGKNRALPAHALSAAACVLHCCG